MSSHATHNGRGDVLAITYLKNLSSRYFCSRCNARVYPYERIMATAEITNDAGRDVLLYSLNNGIEVGLPKWAYCDHCDRYVQANRLTNHDVILSRLRNSNIRFRLPEVRRHTREAVAKAIARRLTA